MRCDEKKSYPHRMAAQSALDMARMLQRRSAAHYEQNRHGPPKAIYRCDLCDQWHITSQEVKG